jgi:hypothetical protein
MNWGRHGAFLSVSRWLEKDEKPFVGRENVRKPGRSADLIKTELVEVLGQCHQWSKMELNNGSSNNKL